MKHKSLLIILLISLNSCALIFNGTKQKIEITSFTSDSDIFINGKFIGKEMVNTKLKRKHDHIIHVRKEGYITATEEVITDIKPFWVVFNSLFNWFAFITDAPTGAWNSFEKKNYVFELKPNRNE